MNSGGSRQIRSGQWCLTATTEAGLRRDITELVARGNLLEARVEDIEAQIHGCLGGES
jgi:hypothetical protein